MAAHQRRYRRRRQAWAGRQQRRRRARVARALAYADAPRVRLRRLHRCHGLLRHRHGLLRHRLYRHGLPPPPLPPRGCEGLQPTRCPARTAAVAASTGPSRRTGPCWTHTSRALPPPLSHRPHRHHTAHHPPPFNRSAAGLAGSLLLQRNRVLKKNLFPPRLGPAPSPWATWFALFQPCSKQKQRVRCITACVGF